MIRSINVDELSTVNKLLESFNYSLTPDSFNNDFLKVLIYCDEIIKGVIVYNLIYDRIEIDYIIVLEDFKRLGIGIVVLIIFSAVMIILLINRFSPHSSKVVEAVKNGDIKHFYLIGGCDGARARRNYYTDLVKATPNDSIVLTLACGKYRFNDLDLGTIGGLPRLMDMGQCNDAFSAIKVAVALAEAFECSVNELPLSIILSWYEQKAVCILLTLLYLGIKNIKIGPSLPAFVSPNVLKFLVENYNIAPISSVEEDL